MADGGRIELASKRKASDTGLWSDEREVERLREKKRRLEDAEPFNDADARRRSREAGMEQARRSSLADIAEISLNTMPNRLLSVAGDSSSEFVSADEEGPDLADRHPHVPRKENIAPATTPASRSVPAPQQSREEKEAAERHAIRKRLDVLKTQLKTEMPVHTTAATAKPGAELLDATVSDDVAHPSLLVKRRRKKKSRRKISARATDDTPASPRAKPKTKRNRKKVKAAMRLPEADASMHSVDVDGAARVARNRPYKRCGRRHKRKGGTATPV